MLVSLSSLLGSAAMWVVGGPLVVVLGAFTLFVGVTLAVALFHSDEARRRHARDILRDLLAVFTFKGRGK